MFCKLTLEKPSCLSELLKLLPPLRCSKRLSARGAPSRGQSRRPSWQPELASHLGVVGHPAGGAVGQTGFDVDDRPDALGEVVPRRRFGQLVDQLVSFLLEDGGHGVGLTGCPLHSSPRSRAVKGLRFLATPPVPRSAAAGLDVLRAPAAAARVASAPAARPGTGASGAVG